VNENEYPKVRVVDAPGFEDFEGELIMEVARPDDVMMSIIGVRGATKTEDMIEIVRSEYVEEIR